LDCKTSTVWSKIAEDGNSLAYKTSNGHQRALVPRFLKKKTKKSDSDVVSALQRRGVWRSVSPLGTVLRQFGGLLQNHGPGRKKIHNEAVEWS